jgi:hypothetical protein
MSRTQIDDYICDRCGKKIGTTSIFGDDYFIDIPDSRMWYIIKTARVIFRKVVRNIEESKEFDLCKDCRGSFEILLNEFFKKAKNK